MKRYKLLAVSLIVIATAMALSSYVTAYMRKQTPIVKNPVIAAEVSCNIVETVTDNKKTSIAIQNTSNIPVYIRVAFISHWEDAEGNIILKRSESINIASLLNGTNWLPNDGCYYYTLPINPPDGETVYDTGNILSPYTSIPLATDTMEGGKQIFQVIDVIAEAIQAEPGRS